jgi:hypothetical protein
MVYQAHDAEIDYRVVTAQHQFLASLEIKSTAASQALLPVAVPSNSAAGIAAGFIERHCVSLPWPNNLRSTAVFLFTISTLGC